MEKACLTTKDIIENNGNIFSILRDKEDEWQFFGKKEPDDGDILIVSIEKIWKLFPDIKNIASNLKRGYYAYRNDIKSDWIIDKYE